MQGSGICASTFFYRPSDAFSFTVCLRMGLTLAESTRIVGLQPLAQVLLKGPLLL